MLDKRQKYLQIALNRTLDEVRAIISQIPLDKRIILEAGTPLIKTYRMRTISMIKSWWREIVLELREMPPKAVSLIEILKKIGRKNF